MMQCRSSPEGPPNRCLDPTISVSPPAAGCGGQDIKDPYSINLRSDPRPWCGTCAAGPQWRLRRSPRPVRSSEIWHSPPGSAEPYQKEHPPPPCHTCSPRFPIIRPFTALNAVPTVVLRISGHVYHTSLLHRKWPNDGRAASPARSHRLQVAWPVQWHCAQEQRTLRNRGRGNGRPRAMPNGAQWNRGGHPAFRCGPNDPLKRR